MTVYTEDKAIPILNDWFAMKTIDFMAMYRKTEGGARAFVYSLIKKYPHLRPRRGKHQKPLIPAGYLIQHYNVDMNADEIGKVYGMVARSVQACAARYRKEGYAIKMGARTDPKPEGTIRQRVRKDERIVREIKQGGKWVRIKQERKKKELSPEDRIREEQKKVARLKYKERQAELKAMKQEDRQRAIAKHAADREAKKAARLKQKASLRAQEAHRRTLDRKRNLEAKNKLKIEKEKKGQEERIKRQALRQQKMRKPERVPRKVSHDENPVKVRIKSTEGQKLVRVNSKTQIYADPNIPDSEVIARWEAKRNKAA